MQGHETVTTVSDVTGRPIIYRFSEPVNSAVASLPYTAYHVRGVSDRRHLLCNGWKDLFILGTASMCMCV